MSFADFFRAAWDRDPFPWQTRLAELALAGQWPSSIGLPTAAGKTALIDIAVYALAMGSPNAARRIFFVVDRRIIVDEAAERAEKLANKLREANSDSELGKVATALRRIGDGGDSTPLGTAVLRGGIARDNSWTSSPRQPLVICSTVDQVGSSLLFRAYGTSGYTWPIRAGLASYDSLIIIDEAHTSQPFVETLGWIRKYRGWAKESIHGPFTVVEMSATPRDTEVFREVEEDLKNELLKSRWEASKHARLVLEDLKTEADPAGERFTALVGGLAREARTMRDRRGAKVIGVIANRVRTARMVFEDLSRDQPERTVLLTGRARAYDRDEIWSRWSPLIGLDREEEPEESIFVVATQCIEVGANIDFDALVTEITSMDALEQRFGRLNRKGRPGISHAAIVAQKDQVGAKYDDRVYGKALAASWAWLRNHLRRDEHTITLPSQGKKKPKAAKIKDEFVEMAVLALRHALMQTSDRSTLAGPRRSAPVLMPAHVDLLCQTSPEPSPCPDPAIFLHGPQTEPADVQVIWRQDLNPDDSGQWLNAVAICPPNAAESISLPIWVVRQWLCKQDTPDLADYEGLPSEEIRGRGENRSVLFWLGPEESEILERAEEVKPGMTVVVPAKYGGCDNWGWNPASAEEVKDVGDAVKLKMGKPMLRFDERLARCWSYSDLASQLRAVESQREARRILSEYAGDTSPWVKKTVEALAGSRLLRLIDDPDPTREDWVAVSGRGFGEQESVWSFDQAEPHLDEHLRGCERWASVFAGQLPELLRATVIKAAALHDIGKADPRFQAWLRGGNPIKPDELIAKSRKSGQNMAAIERARRLADYPQGGRHELASVALLSQGIDGIDDVDNDLLLHLIGSHHGRCRPFAPVIEDADPIAVTYLGWSACSDHKLENLGSGVSDRFWLLTRRYGWYGLAYLETLVRLADHRQSAAEEKYASETAGVANA